MSSQRVHTVILGAGPSGLAAAYTLAKAGLKPVVLERDNQSGGLMRSIKRGDFIVDIGRKELYNRLARVDDFWSALLGSDYRTYSHRGGILFDGRIIDLSPAYQGFRRGMSWGLFMECSLDLLWWRIRPGLPRPRNLEEYWYQQRGRKLTRIANQGFQEKLAGRRWADVPMPPADGNGHREPFARTLAQAAVRAFSSKETNTYKGQWRHPAKGTGQICEALERGLKEAGGTIHFRAGVGAIEAHDGRIRSVMADLPEGRVVFETSNLVSSAPPEFVRQLLPRPASATGAGPVPSKSPRKRVVLLVYLFLNEEPRFPHFFLQVTCPNLKVGRIANYAALNADMVPSGKTSLCCEYYCFSEDPLLALDDTEMAKFAMDECARSGLIDPSKCFDTMVLKFPGADASQNRHNWFSKERQVLFAELRQFENLYSVGRTDIDISTLAGIEAAEAILTGDRGQFDLHFSPAELGIRSESKPFEFKCPAGVEM